MVRAAVVELMASLDPAHRSFIDFGIVSGVTRRRMGYMGKESLWKNKLAAWFFTTAGGNVFSIPNKIPIFFKAPSPFLN